MNTVGHIYAILPREFNDAQQGVLKVGKSTSIDKRTIQYPKGSTMVYSRITNNCHLAETTLIQALLKQQNIIQRKDLGREYFQGNLDDIIATIDEALSPLFKYNDIINTVTTDTSKNNEKFVLQFFDERLCHIVKNTCLIPYADMLKQFISFTEEHPNKIKLSFESLCESLKHIYNAELVNNSAKRYFRFPCEKSPIIDWLFTNYHITDDHNDRVHASDLYRQFIKDTTDNVSQNTFGATLHKMCGIPRKCIRVGSITMTAYLGIKNKV